MTWFCPIVQRPVMGVGVVEVRGVIAGGMGSGLTEMSNERKGKVTVKGHGGRRMGRKIKT